jgi:hypothetical protein
MRRQKSIGEWIGDAVVIFSLRRRDLRAHRVRDVRALGGCGLMGFRAPLVNLVPVSREPTASTELRLRTLLADIQLFAQGVMDERPSLDMAEVERLAKSARGIR